MRKALALPALGYTTLTAREGKQFKLEGSGTEQAYPVRHSQTPGLATSEHSMDNGILGVTIESNGTLTITDHKSGQVFRRLLAFEDIADIGDGWFHGMAVNDQKFVSAVSGADVVLVSEGALFSQFRVRLVMNVPEVFDFYNPAAFGRFGAPLVIDAFIGLRAASDRLEIRTTINDNSKDHRLRVIFPTGLPANTYLADGAFDVVERLIGLPKDNHLRRELSVETTPQQTWTAGRGHAAVSLLSLRACYALF